MNCLNPNELADELLTSRHIITFTDTDEIYQWNPATGLYEPMETWLRSTIQQQAGRDTSTHFVNEVINSIKRKTPKERKEIAEDLTDIPLEDGILNFETMEFRLYTADDIFLTKHPIRWQLAIPELNQIGYVNPIEKFLCEVTSNQTEEVLLKEIVGYCFYRGMPFQNFFLLVGSGANGKSVFLKLLVAMLGQDNVSSQSLQELVEDKFSKSQLYLKNANIFGDLSSKALQDTGVLKQLTGGDWLSARQIYQAPFKFQNYSKIIASCNEVPETPDHSEAFYRRAVLINFPYSFEGKENRNLYEELCTPENLKGFFLICLNAFKDALKENRWIRVETIQDKRNLYMSYSNSAFAFFGIKLEFDPEGEIRVDELRAKYFEFCQEKKLAPKDERVFFKKLMEYYGHKVWKKRKYEDYGMGRYFVYIGVGWKE